MPFPILGHSDCEICGKTFTGKNRTRNFERHMKSEHVDKTLRKWICEICNSEFKFRSLLQRHQNASTCRGKYITKTKIEDMDESLSSPLPNRPAFILPAKKK